MRTIQKREVFYNELENLFEELNLSIADLNSKATGNDKQMSERAVFLLKMFLNPKNRDLLQFFQNIDPNKESILRSLFEHKEFDHFLASLNKEIVLVKEESPRELIKPEKLKEVMSRTAWFGSKGSYIVTLDDKLMINPSLLNYFQGSYEKA